jgi:hypothetical protein
MTCTALARLGLLGLLLCGCSAIVDPDVDSLGVEPLACRPNQQRACPCNEQQCLAVGITGVLCGTQTCNAGGSYDVCFCPPAGMSNSGNGNAGNGGPGRR